MKKLVTAIGLVPVLLSLITGCSPSPSPAEQAAEKTCLQIEQNVDSMAENLLALVKDMEEGFALPWYSWPPDGAVTIESRWERDEVKQDLDESLPILQASIGSYFSNVTEEQFLSKSSEDWERDPGFQNTYYTNLQVALLSGTEIKPKEGIVVTADPDTSFKNQFLRYIKKELPAGCDFKSLRKTVNSLYPDSYTVSPESHIPTAIEIYGCAVFGKGKVVPRGVIACDEEGFVPEPLTAEEYQKLVRQNPFTDPYSNPSLQGLAEFTWCRDQGLEVNKARTGCE